MRHKQRAFSGMVGRPPEPETEPEEKKVGRPREHENNAAKQAAYRDRKVQVAQLRKVFGEVMGELLPDKSAITVDELQMILTEVKTRVPELTAVIERLTNDIAHKTEIELAKSLDDLKPYLPKTEKAQMSMSRGKFMPEAPRGKGRLLYGYDHSHDHVPLEDTDGFRTKPHDVGSGDGAIGAADSEGETNQRDGNGSRTPVISRNRVEDRMIANLDSGQTRSEEDPLVILRLVPPGVPRIPAIRKVTAYLQLCGVRVSEFHKLPAADRVRIRQECWEIAA